MRAHLAHRFDRRSLVLGIAPPIAIALAGLAARTPIALAYPRAAVLLLLWVAADSLTLSLIARAPDRRPAARAILAALAAACVAVAAGSPAPLRDALLGMPIVAGAMLLLIGIHIAWGLSQARRTLRSQPSGSGNRWSTAAGELIPPALVRLAAAELSLIRLALFRWGAPPDVPAASRAFGYHEHLLPIFAVLLGLQLIEILVVHLLVSHWSTKAAWVLFAVSDVGLIYIVGLLKSFRLKPVLLTPEGVHIRTGILIDRFVPYAQIAGLDARLTGAEVKDAGTLNAGLLAWPNLLLRLSDPMPRAGLLRAHAPIVAIAFRLDDPEPFARLLRWRLGQPATR
jgi:hypothetical protein